MATDPLEKKLTEIGYNGLFQSGESNRAVGIWDNGRNREQLNQLIANPDAAPHAVFLAAEVLRHFQIEQNPANYNALAKAYAYALKHSCIDKAEFWGLAGNLWGFLYEEDNAGYLGKQLIKYGNAAVPYLVDLLHQKEGTILYIGSEDATIGNGYRYRVKDFAAYYLSKIKNIPVQFHRELEERDKEIDQLEIKLKK